MIPSYPKIKNLGYRETRGIFDGPVVVQEKLDGSQISFGVLKGELFVRSKGTHRDLDGDAGMFQTAVDEIKPRDLPEGVIFRGEYLRRPRHNAIAYERVPRGHIALFDVENGGIKRVEEWAEVLSFCCVPILFEGVIESKDELEDLIPEESYLGGMCEGVVIKNYATGQMAKMVRPEFREKHTGKKNKKRTKSGANAIIDVYRTEARWQKAVQHLREEDQLVGEPRDIGPLIKEVQRDVFDECEDEIKQALFDHYKRQIASGLVAGFAEWYKEKIAVDPFEE